MVGWLLACIAWPLVVAILVFVAPLRRAGMFLAPWAAFPALVFVLLGRTIPTVRLPHVLLDTRLGLDDIGFTFLLSSAILWSVAAIYARAYMAKDDRRHRFALFFLLTMAGNLALPIAQDVVSFYAAFALMTFAAYGLVVHARSDAALHAGRIYIALVVIGETLLFFGLVMAVNLAQSLALHEVASALAGPEGAAAFALLLVGFGIKVGMVPMHVWLPLAHSRAPTPASAVLSGVLIKAGVLGWLRFLPLGEAPLPWGAVALALGVVAMFYGVGIGLTQVDVKSLLAYSSVAQMGFVTTLVGVGLMAPAAWPTAKAATLFYVLHHALAKGALFLGVGVARGGAGSNWMHPLALAGMTFAALALTGAPFTSGAFAKEWVKDAAASGPDAWALSAGWIYSVAAVGTALLMLRFLMLMRRMPHSEHPVPRGMWAPWGILLIVLAAVGWIAPSHLFGLPGPMTTLTPSPLWAAAWPVLVAIVVFVMWHRGKWPALPIVPVGDVMVPIERFVFSVGRWQAARSAKATTFLRRIAGARLLLVARTDPRWLDHAEARLARWETTGLTLLVLLLAWGLQRW